MESCRFKESIWIRVAVLCTLLSCEVTEPPPPQTAKQLLAIDWQYETLLIAGDTFNVPDAAFEAVQWAGNVSVSFRWFRYDPDGTYELRWDTEGNPIKIGDGLNYQPNFGFWKLSLNEDTLIHNPGFGYETGYKILELTNEFFIREYLRVVQDTTFGDLPGVVPGDIVVYREIFVPRIK